MQRHVWDSLYECASVPVIIDDTPRMMCRHRPYVTSFIAWIARLSHCVLCHCSHNFGIDNEMHAQVNDSTTFPSHGLNHTGTDGDNSDQLKTTGSTRS